MFSYFNIQFYFQFMYVCILDTLFDALKIAVKPPESAETSFWAESIHHFRATPLSFSAIYLLYGLLTISIIVRN